MKNSEKNRDPERAQKRALADARCAWRKLSDEQRRDFLSFVIAESGAEYPPAFTNHVHEAFRALGEGAVSQWRYEERCDGCGRESLDCSHDPCDDVIADRGEGGA